MLTKRTKRPRKAATTKESRKAFRKNDGQRARLCK
jgi:hypothetical protein